MRALESVPDQWKTQLAQPEPEKDPVKLMEQFVEASR
jgi:hypothetical protein